jgi:ankyrin repeat protein
VPTQTLENKEGETPLHLISQSWQSHQERGVGIVRLLLEHGVDVNARRKDGWTSLHLAAFEGTVEVAQVLLDHGANVNAENDEGETPLHLGAYDDEDGIGITRLLLERGVDVHARDKDHDTALHTAAFSGKLEIAKLLIDHGAITTAENELGETPLHMVSRGVYDFEEDGIGIARLLLERGVDVHARDKDYDTALHTAASREARDRKVAYRPWRNHDRGERARRDTLAPSVARRIRLRRRRYRYCTAVAGAWCRREHTDEDEVHPLTFGGF